MKSEKVERILARCKEARNDDRVLYIEYLKEYYGEINEQTILNGPNPASVVRVRAYLQNKRKIYIADKEVREHRKAKEVETRSWLGGFYKNIMSKIS